MSCYDVIVTKRDTRSYADKRIPDDVLRRILQAGRMAGSAKDLQPVRLVVIKGAERKQALAACGKHAPHVIESDVSVALVLAPEEGQPPGTFAYFRGPFDVGRTAQNIMLAAWEEGVTSCVASMHDEAGARRVLGLPPDHVVGNVVALGYPAAGARRGGGSPRVPLEEYVHWEQW